MNYEIKRLNIWSVAKLSFILGGVFGFLAGLLVWMFAGIMSQIPLQELSGDSDGMQTLRTMGAIMPFMMAIFYAVVAMITNALMAALYNILSGLLGGVEMTLTPLTQVAVPPPAAAQATYPPPAPPAPPPAPPSPPAPPTTGG